MNVFCGVSIENCKGLIAVMHKSSSQSNDQLGFCSPVEDLINEILLTNPLFYLIMGNVAFFLTEMWPFL